MSLTHAEHERDVARPVPATQSVRSARPLVQQRDVAQQESDQARQDVLDRHQAGEAPVVRRWVQGRKPGVDAPAPEPEMEDDEEGEEGEEAPESEAPEEAPETEGPEGSDSEGPGQEAPEAEPEGGFDLLNSPISHVDNGWMPGLKPTSVSAEPSAPRSEAPQRELPWMFQRTGATGTMSKQEWRKREYQQMKQDHRGSRGKKKMGFGGRMLTKWIAHNNYYNAIPEHRRTEEQQRKAVRERTGRQRFSKVVGAIGSVTRPLGMPALRIKQALKRRREKRLEARGPRGLQAQERLE